MVHASTRARRSLGPVEFRPPRALGVIVAGGFTAWAFIAALLAGNVALGAEAEFKTFLAWVLCAGCVAIGLLFANWTYALATLSYLVDRDTLQIRWGFRDVTVPIAAIQRMVPGRTLDMAHVSGLNWWGCHVGHADVKRVGFTLFFSTHSTPDELLYVVTTGEAFALTVLDQAAFAEEIQARAELAPVDEYTQRSAATGLAAIRFWRDRVAMGILAVSAFACAVLCAYVFARYPGLPNVIELSFPSLGGVVRVGNKSELLRLAYLGAGILAFNAVVGILLHSRERAAGLWLMAGSGVLQVVLLGAAVLAYARA
jgi:hypothetical protein